MSQPLNNFIAIPEFVIQKLIVESLAFLRKDYQDQVDQYNDETLSYLYYLTENVGIQRLNMFKQAKKIFLADVEDPKSINVHLGFPQKLEGAISICITHSGESTTQNVLSTDEEDLMEEFVYVKDDDNYGGSSIGSGGSGGLGDDSLNSTQESNYYRRSYGRRYTATYQIICTGDNTNESIIVANIIKALLISFEGTGHVNALGFQNCKIGMSDIQIKSDTSKMLFAKVVQYGFEYEFRVPDVTRQQYINAIIWKGIMLNN